MEVRKDGELYLTEDEVAETLCDYPVDCLAMLPTDVGRGKQYASGFYSYWAGLVDLDIKYIDDKIFFC